MYLLIPSSKCFNEIERTELCTVYTTEYWDH